MRRIVARIAHEVLTSRAIKGSVLIEQTCDGFRMVIGKRSVTDVQLWIGKRDGSYIRFTHEGEEDIVVGYPYTLSTARAELRPIGLVLLMHDGGEYRVNKRGGREATAYYTSDLCDAVSTGVEMAKKGAW